MAVGTEAAAGAIKASGEIAAAAVDIVQTAAESLVSVATGGERDRPSEEATDADVGRKEREARKGS
jgi:hypothetical protein